MRNLTSEDDTRQAKKHKVKEVTEKITLQIYTFWNNVIWTKFLQIEITSSNLGEKQNSNIMEPSPFNHKYFNTDYVRIRKKYFYFRRLC